MMGHGPDRTSSADGGFVVAQNGGIDFSVFETFGTLPPRAPCNRECSA